ncbi:MAG: hypothetical protein ABSD50_16260 [Smithella sp.]|jgi:hypothetical protein
MIKPDENVIRAIKNLSGNTSFECIIEWIDNSLSEQAINNCNSVGENTIKIQGRCLELKEILNYINNADNFLINIKQSDKIKNGGIL